jgi:hypothetical protein
MIDAGFDQNGFKTCFGLIFPDFSCTIQMLKETMALKGGFWMSSLVADTQAIVWYLLASDKISAKAIAALDETLIAGDPVYLPSSRNHHDLLKPTQ